MGEENQGLSVNDFYRLAILDIEQLKKALGKSEEYIARMEKRLDAREETAVKRGRLRSNIVSIVVILQTMLLALALLHFW